MAASTASMCFRSESLAVYSCIERERVVAGGERGHEAVGCGRRGLRRDVVGRQHYGCPGRAASRDNTPHRDQSACGWPALPAARCAGATAATPTAFPFTVPVIRALDVLRCDGAVTFFVGENGRGSRRCSRRSRRRPVFPRSGAPIWTPTPRSARSVRSADALRLVWSRRTKRGFFLRAEDFFGFAKRLSQMRSEFLRRLEELEVEYAGSVCRTRRGWRWARCAGRWRRWRAYGVDLDANSHGQSFLKLFQSRFVPGGLYLLDEPEAPLSPQSQLGLIAMIADMVAQDAQFIIATHSPILLAFPGATIVSFDEVPAEAVGPIRGVGQCR